MRRSLSLAIVALMPALAFAADEKVEPKPALSVEAEVASNDRFGKHFLVRLVNTGKAPLTVVTSKLRPKYSEGDKLTVALEFTEQTKHKDRLVVPPADTLGLVKLMPAEVANVTVPVAPFQKALNKIGAKAEVTVTYEVSAFWGKRFGAWHGKVESKADLGK